eukprot:COSAG01_NODE_472_length_16538_cov_126.145690_13_plen_463_part_00
MPAVAAPRSHALALQRSAQAATRAARRRGALLIPRSRAGDCGGHNTTSLQPPLRSGPAEAAAVRALGRTTRLWLQRELRSFLLAAGCCADDAVVLPAAGAHMAGDALAVSDCDLAVLHGPSLDDPAVWTGRGGFLSHLRSRSYVYEPRSVAFGDVDNLQCVGIVPLPGARGTYVRVDISRLRAQEPLYHPSQRQGLNQLLQYLQGTEQLEEGEEEERQGSFQSTGFATPAASVPQPQELPQLADPASIKRLHGLCLNRHLRLTGGERAADLTRALKALAWVNGLYPSRPRRRQGVPGLAWRLLVAHFIQAAHSPQSSLLSEQLLAFCTFYRGEAERRGGHGLLVSPTLEHLPSQSSTAAIGNAKAAGKLLDSPGICMPTLWNMYGGYPIDSVDVCRHLGPAGWRELGDFIRLTAGDGERSLPSAPAEWALARQWSSLDAVGFALSNCSVAQLDGSGVLPVAR